jgi:hypothetical protein
MTEIRDFLDPNGPDPELEDAEDAPDDEVEDSPHNDPVEEPPAPDGAEPPAPFEDDEGSAPDATE